MSGKGKGKARIGSGKSRDHNIITGADPLPNEKPAPAAPEPAKPVAQPAQFGRKSSWKNSDEPVNILTGAAPAHTETRTGTKKAAFHKSLDEMNNSNEFDPVTHRKKLSSDKSSNARVAATTRLEEADGSTYDIMSGQPKKTPPSTGGRKAKKMNPELADKPQSVNPTERSVAASSPVNNSASATSGDVELDPFGNPKPSNGMRRSNSSGATNSFMTTEKDVNPITGARPNEKPVAQETPKKSASKLVEQKKKGAPPPAAVANKMAGKSHPETATNPVTGDVSPYQAMRKSSSSGSMNALVDGSAENSFNILTGQSVAQE